MTDDKELIARLRSMHWCVTTKANGVGVSDGAVAREAADRIEALTKERDAALHLAHTRKAFVEEARDERDAFEAKLTLMTTERDEAWKRAAHAEKMWGEAEVKLAGGVIAGYDDGSTVFLSGYAGGAAIGGAWSTLTLMEKASDGTLRVREYKAQGDWRTTLAEIKDKP